MYCIIVEKKERLRLSEKVNEEINKILEENKGQKIQVALIVGNTHEGFDKFLKEKKLRIIEPKILANYMLEAIKYYEENDRDSFNKIVIEMLGRTGVKSGNLALEVSRRFCRVCDTYRNIMQITLDKDLLFDDQS